MCTCLTCYNFLLVAPFCMHDISKCSLWDALYFVPLWHACLSSSWCPNIWCKNAIWCFLLLLIRTWGFVIIVAFDVCILWAWAPHVFWCMPCHIYRGVCHVFWWSMWWLAQACKLGFVMFLISETVILQSVCCYFVSMYPCGYRDIHAPFGDIQ